MAESRTSSDGTSLADLPPSSKLIHKILEHEGELTQQELLAESRLPQRTLRHGIDLLREEGMIDSRPNPDDARQSVYSLPGDRNE